MERRFGMVDDRISGGLQPCRGTPGTRAHQVRTKRTPREVMAITNYSIIDIGDHEVLFSLKDYSDHGKQKTTSLNGKEFLRLFYMHILPCGFVKIRHYGIYSSWFRNTIMKDKRKMVIKHAETVIERINRLIGVDVTRCPRCRKGKLIIVDIIPRSRSPTLLGLHSLCLPG